MFPRSYLAVTGELQKVRGKVSHAGLEARSGGCGIMATRQRLKSFQCLTWHTLLEAHTHPSQYIWVKLVCSELPFLAPHFLRIALHRLLCHSFLCVLGLICKIRSYQVLSVQTKRTCVPWTADENEKILEIKGEMHFLCMKSSDTRSVVRWRRLYREACWECSEA